MRRAHTGIVRRSDQPAPRQRLGRLRSRLRAAPLPEPVYREFIDVLFGMRLPILGMGLVYVVVTALAAEAWHDFVFALLTLAGAAVTAARMALILGYNHRRPTDFAQLSVWERRYGLGSYAFAALLALLNIRALAYHIPLLHLLTVSLVFSFGAGIVSRISVRPRICVASLLLATVPTIAALAAHASFSETEPLHAEFVALEAVLVAMITSLSLSTVRHLYRSAVQHHTARHDLAQLARRDALTGLPNRLELRERFRERIAAALASGTKLAIHFVDLDGFKGVNDGHGHLAGDAVLQQVSERLLGAVRTNDIVARLGGDEFLLLQADVHHHDEAEMLARRIIKRLSASYHVADKQMRISASIGIATAPDLGLDLEKLIACADAALYRSKNAGKGRLSLYSPESATGSGVAELRAGAAEAPIAKPELRSK